MSEKQILNALTRPRSANNKNSSERPVDALAIKKVNDSLTDNLKSRDASASKNEEERGKKIRKIGRKIVFLDSFLLPPSYKTMT